MMLRLTMSCAMLLMANVAAAAQERYRDPSLPDWAPFSSAVVHNDTIYVSGHVGLDPTTNELVEGGVRAETRQTLQSIAQTLEAVGADMSDVLKCMVFLDDIDDYAEMNDVYREFFPQNPPARSTLGADGLAFGAAVEIECIAAKPERT